MEAVGEYWFGVTGSRNYRLYAPVETGIRWAVREAQKLNLTPRMAHGNCPTGADRIADRVWRRLGEEPKVFNADWDSCGPACPRDGGRHRIVKKPNDQHHPGVSETYCPKAGPRRNREMVASGLRVLLAFPLSGPMRGGTWQCVNAARGAGVDVQFPEQWL